ncbi:hypothetical protein K1719_041785 [Acacia pycnantha]|nr:hypothetical protein K1719_041785 [Acacia pycnantha]
MDSRIEARSSKGTAREETLLQLFESTELNSSYNRKKHDDDRWQLLADPVNEASCFYGDFMKPIIDEVTTVHW